MSEYGTVAVDGDRARVRFERLYDATPQELWKALTDPEQLRGWLAHASRFQLEVGGEVRLDFGDDDEVHGAIRELESGRLLEFSWTSSSEAESVVRFEIVPRERGVLLVLDHRALPRDMGVGYSAGWHAHLDMLAAALAGGALEFTPLYEELRPAYEERMASL
jgi:uncharacterized protein YndB with AHSA1/START domain